MCMFPKYLQEYSIVQADRQLLNEQVTKYTEDNNKVHFLVH